MEEGPFAPGRDTVGEVVELVLQCVDLCLRFVYIVGGGICTVEGQTFGSRVGEKEQGRITRMLGWDLSFTFASLLDALFSLPVFVRHSCFKRQRRRDRTGQGRKPDHRRREAGASANDTGKLGT